MISHCRFTYRIGVAALIVFLISGSGWGAEQESASPAETYSAAVPDLVEDNVPTEEQEPAPAKAETHTLANAFAGYRFLSVNRYGGRAAEFDYLHSSPALYVFAHRLSQDYQFSLEGGYLSEKDYNGDLAYDYKGIYRFKLWTESLFHNLDHEQLFAPPFTLGSTLYQSADLNAGDLYGVRVEQDLAQFRYKPERFPLHLNFGYWRMVKEGTAQMVFADHAFEGTPDTVYSKTRVIDRQTHEGRFGFDTHLGLFDLVYDFIIREFRDHAPVPRDSFIDRLDSTLVTPRFGGLLEHNDTPDSRFYSHKIALHTSLSGGLVGAASYVYGRRENLSNLTDLQGADQAHTITHNVAGDLSYTPCGSFSFALKYRRYEADRNSPSTVVYSPAVNPLVSVRPAIDTQKDTITATLMYRPAPIITLKGEYKGEFLSRDNLDSWVMPGKVATLSYPAHSGTQTGSLTLLSRPYKGLRIKAQYLYGTADNPVYATAFEEKHEGSFLVTYSAANSWGITASTRIARENSDHATVTTLDIVSAPVTLQMPKNKKLTNTTLSAWFVPIKRLTVTGSYGLLRSSSDQAVLFASLLPDSNALTNYTQQSQIFAINSVYHLDERLDLSLALQQVRSYAEFDPRFISLGATTDTGGIKEISQLETVESSLSARADYHITRNFSCAVEYSFRDYDEKNSFLFDGSVNAVMLYLAAKW